MPEEESLGALVAQASTHISTLVRSEIELAKAELKFDAKRVGMAVGLFAAAGFIAHLCLILASFAIAYAMVAIFDMNEAFAFTIVTVFYLLVAGLLVFIGVRRLKGLAKMKRTTRSLKSLASGDEEPGAEAAIREPVLRQPYAGPTAGEVGSHRKSMSDA